MPYIALRRLRVGETQYRDTGEEVPEAESWPNIRPWLDGGFVKEVPGQPAAREGVTPSPAPKVAEAASGSPGALEGQDNPSATELPEALRPRPRRAARTRRMP